jgi:isopenicillin N synthase-like dioxygenase
MTARKQKFVNEIGSAFEDIGFVALKGHFLNDQLVEELYGEMKFFPLPLETKRYEIQVLEVSEVMFLWY